MSKFATKGAGVAQPSTISTVADTTNHEGQPAKIRDAESELFLLGATNLVGEDTFYESAEVRDARFRDLVGQVAVEDPAWLREYVHYLRNELNMRSAAVVVAAEFAYVLHRHPEVAAGLTVAGIVDSALARADEPGEFIAYWRGRFGKLPAGVKRGLQRAVLRLYTQRSTQRYDNARDVWRFGDVLQMLNVTGRTDEQEALFKYLIAKRYGRDAESDLSLLPLITGRRAVDQIPLDERAMLLASPDGAAMIHAADMPWEAVSGWLQGPMTASAWEACIPTMGAMALVRNLRNFDDAGISDEVAAAVTAKLSDPEEIKRSRQFPYRFYSAYRAVESLRWGPALERALDLSTANIPALPGRTLICVDLSQSMRGTLSEHSDAQTIDIAALFAAALAKRSGVGNVDVVGFAQQIVRIPVRGGMSALVLARKIVDKVGEVGGATNVPLALGEWDGHDRAVVISDEQTTQHLNRGDLNGSVAGLKQYYARYGHHLDLGRPKVTGLPKQTHLHVFNTSGYAPALTSFGDGYNHEYGGLNDATFRLMSVNETRASGRWPWEF